MSPNAILFTKFLNFYLNLTYQYIFYCMYNRKEISGIYYFHEWTNTFIFYHRNISFSFLTCSQIFLPYIEYLVPKKNLEGKECRRKSMSFPIHWLSTVKFKGSKSGSQFTKVYQKIHRRLFSPFLHPASLLQELFFGGGEEWVSLKITPWSMSFCCKRPNFVQVCNLSSRNSLVVLIISSPAGWEMPLNCSRVWDSHQEYCFTPRVAAKINFLKKGMSLHETIYNI